MMVLTYDSRHDRKANLRTIANASWADVEEAVRRLDAGVHTEVALGESAHLAISGGAGRYFVSMFTEDERSLVLTDKPKSSSEMVRLVAGGQEVLLPAEQVVDIAAALKAARAFFEGRGTDHTQSWAEE